MADEPLPGFTADARYLETGDPRVLDWVKEAVQEGERINKADPNYLKMDTSMEYVSGQQVEENRPSYLPRIVVNQTKKSTRAHVATLTDLKPVFAYKTFNPAYQDASALLNKAVIAWWVNSFADLDLGDVIKYSLTTGSGDCVCEYDPHFGAYGDNKLMARDCRDTLPIRPSRDRSIQNWEGVIIREAHSPNVLRGMFPEKAHLLKAERDGGSWGAGVMTKFKRMVSGIRTPTVFDHVGGAAHTGSASSPELTLYRTFLNDRSVNLSTGPVLMGKAGTAWAYLVQPGDRLYPRKRLIVATEKVVLYDGPNPYWHGMYPVSRLQLDPWPWLFFGLGLCNDLKPMQDGINTAVNDIFSTFSQWVNRGTIADKNSVPESLLKRFDPRQKNWKMKLNPTYGEGFKLADGPTLPPWTMEFLTLLFDKFDEHSGTANLQALLQLRQMPSGDTIEKYNQAMTPEIRLEGRMMEAFLRDIAEMIKVNIFQFYSAQRRVMILGDAALTLNDFDYDPGTLVPAMTPDMPGYTKELDKSLSRDVRAQFFHHQFSFYVEPNSILALNSQEKKMEALQLSRMGLMDVWTLHETLGTPNVGLPPAMPLPPLDPAAPKPPLITDGMTGEVKEIRVPTTITERLMVQQMIGMGAQPSAAGRPPSGNQPPRVEEKTNEDGSKRTTIAESE